MTDTTTENQPKYTAQLKKLLADPPEYKRSPSLQFIARIVKENCPGSTIETYLAQEDFAIENTALRMECIHVHRNDDIMIIGAIYDNNIIIFTMQSIVRNLFDNARTVFFVEESHPEFDEPDYGNDDDFGEDDAESSITFDAEGNVIAVSHNGDCIYFV